MITKGPVCRVPRCLGKHTCAGDISLLSRGAHDGETEGLSFSLNAEACKSGATEDLSSLR